MSVLNVLLRVVLIKDGNGRQRQRRSTTSNYKGYEKQFYEELKTKGDLDKFLDLLNKEEVCTKITDTEGGTINFKTVNSGSASGDGNGSNKTFYHSDYCQPCPPCGVEKKSNGEFQEKPETKSGECDGKKPYTIKDKATSNDIEVLSFGDKGEDRETKLKKFCTQTNGDTINSGGSGTGGSGGGSNSEIKDLIEKWQCYEEQDIKKHGEHDLEYDRLVTGAGGLCILENKNKKESQSNPQNEPDQFQKTFNDFFYFWIGRFLNDSMYWRGKVNSCINNPKRKKCKNDCEKLCGCFQRWIKKKKDEWDKIVEHFNKQNMGENNLYGNFGHDVVLKTVLKLDELFNNIKSGYGNAKELEGINKMLEKEKKREKEEAADGTDNENNTTIDKLLQHEGDEAKGCLEKRKDPCPLPEDKSRGRSAETREDERTQQPADDTSHAASDDEDDEDGDEVEETETEAACPTKYVNGREKFPNWKCVTPSDTKSVATGESSPSRAKRAASGDTTGKSDGSICVPPRRRKLYIGKIKEWAKKQAGDKGESKSQVNGDGDSESSDSANGDKQTQQQAEASNSTLATSAAASTETPESSQLRDAFVKSAAVETFFLWHRYKKEWEAQKAAEKAREGGLVPGVGGVPGVGALGVGGAGIPGGPGMAEGASLQPQQLPTLGPTVNGDPDDPEQQLKSGNIPPDFLRQMFYTLGDYRDICVGNTDIVSKASSEEHKKAMEKIKENIEKILPKNGGTSGVKPAPKSSVTTPQQTWWKDNAQHIWKGMICALTHKTETPGEVDNEVYNKFFGENNNKNPGTNTGTAATPNGTQNGTTGTTGTYESTYKYDIVKLKEEETSGPKSTTPTQTTHLSEFVLRPPYFRYLEEWGENFCKERMKRLKQIKKDCKVGQGNGKNGQRCSGFGEDCDDNLLDKKYDILPSFNCQSCGTPCAFYRKWIRRKKEEFIKQKNAYNEQKDKCQTQSNNNAKEFCAKLKETCTDAAAFLQKLGSCKKDSGKDKLNFKKPDDTFKDAEDCKPCSEFKIDCTKAKCSGTNGNNCKDNKITAEKIGNGVDSTVLDMLVSDNSGNGVEGVLDECAGANIFKGIRKEEWECGNVCGYEVCKPKIVEGQENGKNQIILITAFVKHWVENFLEDYNKIKHKISQCTKSGERSKCISGCDKKCKCVKKWISTKKQEWEKIRKRFLEQYKGQDYYNVKTILEEFKDPTEVLKAIKPCPSLDDFQDSKDCAVDASSKQENGEKKDVVECLIHRLEKHKDIIDKCKHQQFEESVETSGENEAQCDEKSAPVEDEDDTLDEETEVKAPNICPKEDKPTEAETDDKCGEIEEKKDEKKDEPKGEASGPAGPAPPGISEETNNEETSSLKPEEEAPVEPAPKPAPAPAAPPPYLPPPLVTSTLAWSVGIGFAAFTYFYLKVNG
ncbi:hypothetical protein PFFVO_06107, partial [Plasmodium falciparum Vietnam Oak-Knoll (FVO)]